jgi:hypothetical protein
MAGRKRVVISVAAVAVIGLGVGLGLVFYPRGTPLASSSLRAPSASAPDLTSLVRQLTSADPRVEAQALAPGGGRGPGQPRTLLPAGSRLAVEPGTWRVTGADSSGAPAAGQIRARLTEPDHPGRQVYLGLIKLDGRWRLYETSAA